MCSESKTFCFSFKPTPTLRILWEFTVHALHSNISRLHFTDSREKDRQSKCAIYLLLANLFKICFLVLIVDINGTFVKIQGCCSHTRLFIPWECVRIKLLINTFCCSKNLKFGELGLANLYHVTNLGQMNLKCWHSAHRHRIIRLNSQIHTSAIRYVCMGAREWKVPWGIIHHVHSSVVDMNVIWPSLQKWRFLDYI